MLTRAEKEKIVRELSEKLRKSQATFVADYRGITANSMVALRKRLREEDVEFRVVKNTLLRLAVRDTQYEALTDYLKGPVAIAMSFGEPSMAAKALTGFAEEEPNLKLMGGVLGGKSITVEDIKGLASLPTRDELVGKMMGILKNVPAGLVGVLAGIERKLLYLLTAIKEKKEKGG